MKRLNLILLLLFGFIMSPNFVLACGSKSEKSCCGAKKMETSCKMKCCQKQEEDNSNKGCDGKCDKNTCQVQSIFVGAVLPSNVEIEFKKFIIETSSKLFFHKETVALAVYLSIWTPPNLF
jgi:hypothetical protein